MHKLIREKITLILIFLTPHSKNKVIVLCEICSVLNLNSFFWSYNLEYHYSLSHTNVDLPEEVKRIKNEKLAVLKKFKTKNKIN